MRAEHAENRTEPVQVDAQEVTSSESSFHSLASERFPNWSTAERPVAESTKHRSRPLLNVTGELIDQLRGAFDQFIVTQLNDLLAQHTNPSGFGLGRPGFEPVNCQELIQSARDTLSELHILERMTPKGSNLSLVARTFMLEMQSLVRAFLVDFSSMAPEGELNRSELTAAVAYCIDVAKGLGKLSLGLEEIKLEMRAGSSAA
jgi:hypothetical protein